MSLCLSVLPSVCLRGTEACRACSCSLFSLSARMCDSFYSFIVIDIVIVVV